LFINGGLVIHKSYAKIVSQNILYLNYSNQSIRQELQPRGTSYYNVPYLLVKFKEFNTQNHTAIFEFYLSDENMQVNIEYLKNDTDKDKS